MATLTYSEATARILDALVSNTATDVPVPTAEMLRAVNTAYSSLWEISGGGAKTVASATAWTTAQTATGVVSGLLTNIKRINSVWASTTSGSVGVSTDDSEVTPKELAYIQWLRKSFLTGTYARPKHYSVTRLQTETEADKGKLRLDYWPGLIGYYFPIEYIPQFTPMDGTAGNFFDLNDLETYDLVWLASADLAPRLDRSDLIESLLMNVSEATAKVLERKLKAMMSGDQDDAA